VKTSNIELIVKENDNHIFLILLHFTKWTNFSGNEVVVAKLSVEDHQYKMV